MLQYDAKSENDIRLAQLQTMLRLEQTVYNTIEQDDSTAQHQHATAKISVVDNDGGCDNKEYYDDFELADFECRAQVSDWFFQIVNHFGFARQTAMIAMYYLDLFMDRTNRNVGVVEYEVASIACLYLALKMHDPVTMTPQQLVIVSGYICTVQELEDMELQVLNTLQWHVNPPTPTQFVHLLLDVMDFDDEKIRNLNISFIEAQIEATLKEYCYIHVNKSTIAIAAIYNAMMENDDEYSCQEQKLQNVAELVGVEAPSLDFCNDLLSIAHKHINHSTTTAKTATSNKATPSLQPNSIAASGQPLTNESNLDSPISVHQC